MNTVIVLALLLGLVQGFAPRSGNVRMTQTVRMSALTRGLQDSSLPLAELFSGPSAKYNGELIMPGLKTVKSVKEPLPAGTKYGDVSSDGLPALGSGLIVVVALAAAVPYFLSIGESAQSQQRVREAGDKTNPYNQFVNKARPPAKSGVVVGVKKSTLKSAPAKPAAAPAAPAAKKSSPFSFAAKPAAKPAAAPAAKKSSIASFSFAAKPAAPAAKPAAKKSSSPFALKI